MNGGCWLQEEMLALLRATVDPWSVWSAAFGGSAVARVFGGSCGVWLRIGDEVVCLECYFLTGLFVDAIACTKGQRGFMGGGMAAPG